MMKCVRLARKVAFMAMDLRDAKVAFVAMVLRDVKVAFVAMVLKDVKVLIVMAVLRDVVAVRRVAAQWGHPTPSDLLNMPCILILMGMENSIRRN